MRKFKKGMILRYMLDTSIIVVIKNIEERGYITMLDVEVVGTKHCGARTRVTARDFKIVEVDNEQF